ncbi:hypothetical protein Henu3_gp32 [Mycobacterium phage Henu3 PeY-2017]|nr:hypothetical protein Henu3_gp32 [Mycobacterium phage Henu3 PeY-2017]
MLRSRRTHRFTAKTASAAARTAASTSLSSYRYDDRYAAPDSPRMTCMPFGYFLSSRSGNCSAGNGCTDTVTNFVYTETFTCAPGYAAWIA